MSDATTNHSDITTLPPASLARRLGVILYDCLLLLGVLMIAGGLWLAVLHLLGLSTEPGEAVDVRLSRLYYVAVIFFYFGYFWTHGGQTLPMKTWRIRLIDDFGHHVTWPQALMRFCTAALSWLPLGLGFWWSLIESDKRCWHDRLSRTRLVVEPKK